MAVSATVGSLDEYATQDSDSNSISILKEISSKLNSVTEPVIRIKIGWRQ